MHCEQVKHTHFLYLDGEREVCPCCERGIFQTVMWSLETTSETYPYPYYWEISKPPVTVAAELWNKTAQKELIRILSKDTDFIQCKFLLHYIFGLPKFIEREPLIKIFGEKVGSWCGYQGGLELVKIAEVHVYDVELDVALESGFKLQMDEMARLKEKRGEEEKKK